MAIFLYVLISFVMIIILIQCRVTLGFTFKMEGLVCSAFITIYIFQKIAVKNISIYPPNEEKKKRKKKAKKVKRKRDLNQLKVTLKVLINLFNRSLIVNDFELHVKEGTGDACYTAILHGFLWSLTALIPKKLLTKYKIKDKQIRIEPDFNKKIWNVNFNCIFSLKIVNIIFMCKELLIINLKIRKGGDADVRSSDRRSNDYSHAEH